MPEKLMNIKEVAAYLKLPEEEVKRLSDLGEIPAYRIGGSFLRFRKEQIDAVRSEITTFEDQEPVKPKPVLDAKGRPAQTYTRLEREIRRKEPIVKRYDYSTAERVSDFFYFHDFYILSAAIIFTLLYLIFRY